MTSGNRVSPSQVLALFNAGEWSQVLRVLHRADDNLDMTTEMAAVLGICELFSGVSPEPGNHAAALEKVQPVEELLRQGEATGWPDVTACQTWLQILRDRQLTPDRIPAALDLLADACRSSEWWPIWSLTFSALADYDRRPVIRELLDQVTRHLSELSSGFILVLAEAELESASTVQIELERVQNVDVHDCRPLAPDVAYLWQQWLLAERAWWDEREADRAERVQTQVTEILAVLQPEDDVYSSYQWRRLTRRAALLATRCALSQRDFENARGWLESAARSEPNMWDIQYQNGLSAWLQGRHQDAQNFLKRSLAENPFQSRVRFELGLLLFQDNQAGNFDGYLDAMPGVHDAVSSQAIVLFHLGQETESRQHLEQLDRAEAPYARHLIWPQARNSRLRQGRELRAYLAEANRDWKAARKYWDEARQVNSSAYDVSQTDSVAAGSDLANRAHRLYLLGRQLESTDSVRVEDSERVLYSQFQKELGKLSIRPLTGDAMFYRGVAAVETMPDRSTSDWRALLRQSRWKNRVRKREPRRLLYLGDQLMQLGVSKDAYIAYRSLSTTSTVEAQERALAASLITQHPLEASELLRIFDAAYPFKANDSLWLYLRSMCLLAKEPPDYETVRPLLEHAHRAGSSPGLTQVGELLCAYAANEPDAVQRICSFLDKEEKIAFPVTLWQGLESLCLANNLETLRRFKDIYGDGWMNWHPFDPTAVAGRQLSKDCSRFEFLAAMAHIQEAESLGIDIPDGWKTFVYVSQAIQLALGGDFEAAKRVQQHALNSASSKWRWGNRHA